MSAPTSAPTSALTFASASAVASRPGPVSQPTGAPFAVIGCGGGAGASTLTAALAAVAARRGYAVGIIDLDATGGGLDVVFGIEQTPGVRWCEVCGVDGELDGCALFEALPGVGPVSGRSTGTGSIGVLSHGREPAAVPEHVVAAVVAALITACDLVLIDACSLEELEVVPVEVEVVVVVHATVRGTGAAAATASALRQSGREPVLVLRDGSSVLATQVADVVEAPVLARIRTERRVERALARGIGPGARGALASSCEHLLDALMQRRDAS
ncbi:MAG: P-loop NTPase [Actinomycetota bacterium]|nr:P-loop NTPase [Actinomycetota bacterium]